MKTLCIVSCGKAKIWDKNAKAGPTKAKDVYTGPFVRKCQEYARKFYPNSWFIISSKYGFLRPNDIIPVPYNVCFNDRKTNPINLEKLKAQAAKRRLGRFGKIVVLGGRNYVAMMEKVFGHERIDAPLSGCRAIGFMMKRLLINE
jgi:hypothetical protein